MKSPEIKPDLWRNGYDQGYKEGKREGEQSIPQAVAEERERMRGVIEKLQNDGLNVIIEGDYYVNFRDVENILSSLPLPDKE